MGKHVGGGIYAGLQYIVWEKDDGKKYIGFPGDLAAELVASGADMSLLQDIGEKDPEDVMAEFVPTIPPPEE